MDDKLRQLLDASAKLAQEKEIRPILILLADITRSLLSADRASIFLLDQPKNELWTIFAHGVEEIRIPASAGIAGHVCATGEILNINDAYTDPRFNQETDRKTGYKTQNILAYPLRNREGAILGVFQIINKIDHQTFLTEDIQLLGHLSLYVASTIQNAWLTEQLQKAREDAVYRLSYATKYKDPETRNHIIRVGLYAEIMARELGWNREDCEMIRLAAPMHDIGKVGIPDHILQKPGKLTLEEWDVMRKHSQYGYDILQSNDSGLMYMASMVAIDHHEKWNGTGYPNRKKGEEISMGGRLTAISDVFDALTSKRCYKEAWSYQKSIQLIQEESGSHFDPQVVRIFCDHLDEMIRIRDTYQDED